MYEGFRIDFYEKLLAVCNVDNMLSKKEIKVEVPKHRKMLFLINNKVRSREKLLVINV